VSASERQRELRRRRHRKKKMVIIRAKAEKASPAEKAHLAEQVRRLTPGAEELIARMGLEDAS
jgi:hypothetical protein